MAFPPIDFCTVIAGKKVVVATLSTLLGGHWIILQCVAWMGMAVSNVQVFPVKEALAKTFDGSKPCQICHFVASGKAKEQKRESEQPAFKLEYCLPASPLLPSAKLPDLAGTERLRLWALDQKKPPTPPPDLLPG